MGSARITEQRVRHPEPGRYWLVEEGAAVAGGGGLCVEEMLRYAFGGVRTSETGNHVGTT